MFLSTVKGTLIALKRLFSPDSLNPVELDVLRVAQHPNVMRLYGATQYDNKVYMFQEYAMGNYRLIILTIDQRLIVANILMF